MRANQKKEVELYLQFVRGVENIKTEEWYDNNRNCVFLYSCKSDKNKRA